MENNLLLQQQKKKVGKLCMLLKYVPFKKLMFSNYALGTNVQASSGFLVSSSTFGFCYLLPLV